MSKIADFFKLRERNTSHKKELIAGIITLMTMVYVLVVQPEAIVGYEDTAFIIDANGIMITKEVAVTTCVIISGLVTPLMALYTSLPFALAVGMGSNFMFGVLIQSQQLSFGGAMAMTLISGAISLSLTIFGIHNSIVRAMPKDIKISIGTVIGFFIAHLGFKNTRITVFTESGMGIRNLTDPAAMLAVPGLVIIAILAAYKVNGAILIGIAIVTLLGVPAEVTIVPSTFAKVPDFTGLSNVVFNLDFKFIFSFSSVTLISTAFYGDFSSMLGTILGASVRAGILDENGDLPSIQQSSLVGAIGTCVGAPTGNTVIAAFVESSVDVEADGCTGFTSVVVSIIFMIMVFLSPLVLMTPNAAIGLTLISVGFLMISSLKDINLADFTESSGLFVMIAFTVFTGSVASDISTGILAFAPIETATGKFREVHPIMYVMAIPLICCFIYRQSKRCMRTHLFERGSVVHEAAAGG